MLREFTPTVPVPGDELLTTAEVAATLRRPVGTIRDNDTDEPRP